jgi:predicted aspartyl protease
MRNIDMCCRSTVLAFALAPTSAAATDHASALPFRLHQGHLIVVKGAIGAADRLDFLIDTGTSHSLIDKNTARKLRLQSLPGRHEVEGFSQNDQAREVIVPELRIGPLAVPSASLLVVDLSSLSWQAPVIDVVIGLDLLQLSSFRIDYKSRHISFGSLESSPSAVPFRTVFPLLSVDLGIGIHRARLMVDTGAPRLTLFPNRMRSRLPDLLVRNTKRAQGVGGLCELRDVELDTIRLGPTEWRHVPAFLMDADELSFAGLDGVLAPSSLAIRSIDFDFQHNRLSWDK